MTTKRQPYLVRTCRFCGTPAHRDWLVKYGTRHYAHFACMPLTKINELPAYELRRFNEWLNQEEGNHVVAP